MLDPEILLSERCYSHPCYFTSSSKIYKPKYTLEEGFNKNSLSSIIVIGVEGNFVYTACYLEYCIIEAKTMTETILVGIIVAASTLLGVWITQCYESKRRESEERRWYADYFLGRKIDALNNLYATLVDCHFTMNFYGNCSPSTLQEYKEKVQSKEEAYLRAKVMASIFLDDETSNLMSAALGAFRQAGMAIWLSLPDDQCPANKNSYDQSAVNFDWAGFNKTYDSAVACLKDMLNPKILEHVEKRKGV